MNPTSVMIKSNKYGLIVILDDQTPFEKLLEDVAFKFQESAKFFRNAQLALSFRGRRLSAGEEHRLVETIVESCQVHILCIVDELKEDEDYYRQILSYAIEDREDRDGLFYRQSLQSGQKLETDNSVIILGDVHPGATVSSKGNVIILGACRGTVSAGAYGDKSCFIFAQIMKPIQLRIADKTVRSAIVKHTDTEQYETDPKVAFLKDDHIRIESAGAEAFREMSL